LKDLNASPKVETSEKGGVGVCSLVCNTSRVERRAGVPGWGLGQVTNRSIIHNNLRKPNNIWLVCGWSTFGAWTNHEHTRTHKTHHGLDLGKPPTSPLYYSPCLAMGLTPKCHFVLGFSSWMSRNSRNWDSYNFGSP